MSKFLAAIRSPVGAGIITVLTLIVGYVGRDRLGPFIALAVVLVAFQVVREYASHAEERRNKPGESLWRDLNNAYRALRKADVAALDVQPVYSKKGRKDALLEALRALAQLTRTFNNLNGRHRVGANLMMFRDRASIEKAGDIDAVRSRLMFTDKKTLDERRGVLELDMDLSVGHTGGAAFEIPDRKLKTMTLPVPLTLLSEKTRRKLVVPGAAEAFLTPDGYFLIGNTAELRRKAADYSLTPDEWDAIEDYYKSEENAGRYVGSFASLVIFDPTRAEGSDDRLAVVNLHSDRPNLFQDKDAFLAFRNFLAPVLMDIGEFLVEDAP